MGELDRKEHKLALTEIVPCAVLHEALQEIFDSNDLALERARHHATSLVRVEPSHCIGAYDLRGWELEDTLLINGSLRRAARVLYHCHIASVNRDSWI
jgi:hypothetical protein